MQSFSPGPAGLESNQNYECHPSVGGESVQTSLCNVCQTIDFYHSCDYSLCPDCVWQSTGIVTRPIDDNLDIGSLGTLDQNQACPGCNLILACIKTYYHRDLPPKTSRVILRRVRTNFVASKARLEGSQCDGVPSATILQVLICRHGIQGQSSNQNDQEVGAITRLPKDTMSLQLSAWGYKLFATPRLGHECESIPREVGNFANSDLMRNWLQQCREQHGHVCAERLPIETPEAMIRLFDTEELRLVRGNLQMKFVALSYVWGSRTRPLLTTSVEASLSRPGGLRLGELPKTLRDAVNLTRSIGQRYLWVDSGCIMQDDEVDKEQQLNIMDSVYNCAEIVLVAATSTSAYSGIPGASEPRREWHRPIASIRGSKFTVLLPNLLTCLDSTTWQSRGWTFQEGLLANRLLIFDDLQVHWNCRATSHSENIFSEYSDTHPELLPQNSLLGKNIPRSCRVRGAALILEADHCHSLEYTRKVESFTSRSFTNQADVLWAFSGILKLLKPHFPDGYIWGIPWNYIDAMLLWNSACTYQANSISHTVSDRRQRSRKLPFPSWTWLAKGCNVHYHSCGVHLASKVTWHDPVAYPDNSETDCGRIIEPNQSVSFNSGVNENIDQFTTGTSGSVCDFALLQFDAQVAYLDMEFIRLLPQPEGCKHGQMRGEATILSPDGHNIGSMICSEQFLSENFNIKRFFERLLETTTIPSSAERYRGEFIHLSSYQHCVDAAGFCKADYPANAGTDDWHAPGCQFADNVNLMLIEWDKDNTVAYRVGITSVEESLWSKVQTQPKRIILG